MPIYCDSGEGRSSMRRNGYKHHRSHRSRSLASKENFSEITLGKSAFQLGRQKSAKTNHISICESGWRNMIKAGLMKRWTVFWMNRRQKELLRTLLTDLDDVIHIQDLADELDCSEKTVRNDLNKINTLLKEYPSAKLRRKRGIGVSLSAGNGDRAKLFNRVYHTETGSGSDRLLEMAYQLLVSDKPLTLASLAEKYYTNKTTVRDELNRIARWLAGYDLELESKQRLGHLIKGKELNKRNALANLSELIPSESREKRQVLQLFPQHEINTVKKLLRDLQAHYPVNLTDGEFESLLIHALVMIKRTRQRSPIL